MIDWQNAPLTSLPPHMREGVRRYVLQGVPPGEFLYAVLCNQLVEAYAKADYINEGAMRDWASFLYNHMPIGSWGSKKKVADWVNSGGLLGQQKESKK